MNTKTIYIILGVIVIAFLGYYFINNQANPNRLPADNVVTEDADDTSDLKGQASNLQGQVKDLQNKLTDKETISPVTSVKEYKTYTNSDFGISFNYPKAYDLAIKDNRLGELSVILKDGDNLTDPSIGFIINPEGFGPIWTNIKYYLSYNNGQLDIVNRITQACEYCDNEGIDAIQTLIQTNKDTYFFNSQWPRSGESREQDTKDIIESFRF